MTKICLVRHGQTNWNLEKKLQGRTDNFLNETGKKQAFYTAKYINENKIEFDLIGSSTLSRAVETASIIAKNINYEKELFEDECFVEREFGEGEGLFITDSIYEDIYNDNIVGMESKDDLIKRARESLLSISQVHKNKSILIVAHSHFIKAAIMSVTSEFKFKDKLANSCLSFFEVDNDINLLKYNIIPYDDTL